MPAKMILKVFLPRGSLSLHPEDLLYILFIGTAAYMLFEAQSWFFNERIGPTVVGTTLIIAASISLIYLVFSERDATDDTPASSHRGIHMDLESSRDATISRKTVILRAALFFGWFLAFLFSMAIIGLIPTTPLMIIAYMRLEGREPWKLCILLATSVTILIYVVFERIIHVPWPRTLLGEIFPALGAIIPSI